ncbi:DUF1616 domain-containing protein [Methanobacterium sp. CWC-01]|uniref:DUF1616 domain-containing protein n=1 Tax=Methanobacterium aridiramus TaxID=2584467 RepID=UPI002578A118|nr:DUF1616 domain-containing protein [Methanobacterium sp. CWC-01]WJI10273.1 DUF1616 domain-containing protein [Methanobacterium sp. CWC-01]
MNSAPDRTQARKPGKKKGISYWDLVLALILTGLSLSILLFIPNLVLASYFVLLVLLIYTLLLFILPQQKVSTTLLTAILAGLILFLCTLLLWLSNLIIFPPLTLLYLMGITTLGLLILDILSRKITPPEKEWRGEPPVKKREPAEELEVEMGKPPEEEPSLEKDPAIKEGEILVEHDAKTLRAAEQEATTPEEPPEEEEKTPEIIIVDHEAEEEEKDEALLKHPPEMEEIIVDHTPEEEVKGPLIPRDEEVEVIIPEHSEPPADVKEEKRVAPPEKYPERKEPEKAPEEKIKSMTLVTREKEVKVIPPLKPDLTLPWIQRQEELDSRKNYLPLDLLLAGILSFLGMWLVLTAQLELDLFKTILGIVLVLFLPGFSLVATIFTHKDQLASLERMALSVGLSIGITPLVALSLNYTPYGLNLDPLLLILSGQTLIFCLVAYQRRSSLHLYQRYTILQRGKRSF